jgi:drug/metabolite transporter (DMT)-like permease
MDVIREYTWFLCALGAAVFWGLQYAASEQILKVIPTATFTVLYSIGLAAAYLIYFTITRTPLQLDSFQSALDFKVVIHFLLVVLLGCVGTLLIFSAIQQGNATKASIVEITYPLFVALFATWIYKEHGLNLYTYIGGAFTFAGIIIIMKA